jgi:hypothetical protein
LGSVTHAPGKPTVPMDEPQGIEAGYLAYIVGPDLRFLWSREFVAADDDAARKFATQLGDYVELWCGNRFVGKIRPTK